MSQNSKEAFKECWPHGFRNDPKKFVNCLLKKLGNCAGESVWTKDERGVQPTVRERARLRAILDAWAGYIDSSYLDAIVINKFSRSEVTGGKKLGYSEVPEYVRRMYNIMTTQPNRFIKKVGDSLAIKDHMLTEGSSTKRVSRYIGEGLWEGWSVDTYFNFLLKWEEHHVFNVIDWVTKSLAKTSGGKRGQDVVVQAVLRWLNEQKSKPKDNIYKRYERYKIFTSGKY
jgi:hypothetical protein